MPVFSEFSRTIFIGPYAVSLLQILELAVVSVAIIALIVFLRRSILGLAIRAATREFSTVQLMGIRANRVIATAFALSGFLAGIAAIFIVARRGSVDPDFGFQPVIKAFVACVIGGFGSLSGAVLGGMLLGFLEVAILTFLPQQYGGLNDAIALLKVQEDRARDLDYEPSFALEYEFGLFIADHNLMREGRYRELKPCGHSYVNYDLVRTGDYQSFVADLIDRMASLEIGVSSFVTEYGYGMYEFALTPKPPLQAADDAVRAKLHLREFCAERGLVATFMTRFQPPGRESACGAHHHQSLWRDGRNVFAAGPKQLTEVGTRYLAGLLSHLPETHLLYRPTINSYRRFDRGAWSPEDASWGYENRTAAIRAITTPTEGAARLEHRVPGADINPYLTIAAMLASGLAGIEHKLPLEEPAPGNPAALERPPLARTLKESIEAFRASDFVTQLLGSELKAHYLLSREAEQSAFDDGLANQITDFEFQRYFIGT